MSRQDYPIGDTNNGQIVQLSQSLVPIPVRGGGYPVPTLDFLWLASFRGDVYVSGDADQNDVVTGQTSFAATTPTFMIDVPAGINVVPLFLNLSQTGVVAGGAIDVIIEIDKVKRYASGGTSEKVFNTVNRSAKSSFYTGATATAGYGMTVFRATIGQDVSPAEGAIPGPFWKPDYPMILHGPASFLVYTYAGTTGPTWFWQAGFIELTDAELENFLGTYRAA